MTPRHRYLLFTLVIVVLGATLYRRTGVVWQTLPAEARGTKTVKSVVAETLAAGNGLSAEEAERAERLTLIGLKEERALEVWSTDAAEVHEKIRSYSFTAFSGEAGPKLREGDLQIPEGIYEIEYLNPQSRYHLSIKLNYPNAFDRARGKEDEREFLGGDIFIHGRAVTIGCIPIGDEAIEDLFAIVAQVGKSKVSAIIAPGDFRDGLEIPEIESVEWEADLYEIVSEAMKPFVSVGEQE